jgi:hypothetical protein
MPYQRRCPRCGQTFATDYPTKTYCGTRCREHARRIRRTAEAAAYRAASTGSLWQRLRASLQGVGGDPR